MNTGALENVLYAGALENVLNTGALENVLNAGALENVLNTGSLENLSKLVPPLAQWHLLNKQLLLTMTGVSLVGGAQTIVTGIPPGCIKLLQ